MKTKTVTAIVLTMLFLGVVSPIGVSVAVADSDGESGDFVTQSSVDWWPMFRHDPRHTGYSTSTAPNTNHTIWSYTTGHLVWSSPAVADGKVYVGSDDNHVYCLDALTGDFNWSYKTGGDVSPSPAVADGKVYVGSQDHHVYCLDALTGDFNWSYATLEPESPAVADGKVYVGSGVSVYCLPQNDPNGDGIIDPGEVIWSYATDDRVTSSPAVADGKVYVGSWDNNVYCLDALTGDFNWSYATGDMVVWSSPAVADGRVYVGSRDGNVYCLPQNDPNGDGIIDPGEVIWSYATDDLGRSSPAVADGKVYVGSAGDGNVYCLDALTGDFIWSYATSGAVESSPAVADGKVYVGSNDGNVYCLDALTGDFIWSYATSGAVWSSPAVADGKVYVGSFDNKVYAFGTYDVTIEAYCFIEDTDVSVSIIMDGLPTGYTTPHTFTNLAVTHNFTVPNTDPNDHPFNLWSTGETSTTITVTSTGTYTAYYELIHDIAIIELTASPTIPSMGELTFINATVENQGNYTETFEVSVYYTLISDPLIGTQPVIDLLPSENRTLTFEWTPGWPGRYEILANTTEILREADIDDNTRITIVHVEYSSGNPESSSQTVHFLPVALGISAFFTLSIVYTRKRRSKNLGKRQREFDELLDELRKKRL